ncbi:TRAP transporter large permease [uncultured Cohaesibacter sp.]|uniref:TRAP transporter large permease n=1 Tax=uncultured Cohaesibacter sp. TaxID=1002546 RepID=UPI0029C924E0|nr:TRAP transporter large permease [uncultured Cohaesibacter sp.]
MAILVTTFAVLLLLGTPIAITMIASSGLVIWLDGIPLTVLTQRVYSGLQSFPLLAIPLFILAGVLMNESGISDRLFGFTRALVGHIRGGLAQTIVVGNVLMAGISGSSIADTAATARVLVPQLEKAGYGRPFGAAISAVAGSLGPIIPPSILMVIYAWLANVSLGALFVSGIIPGILMACVMMSVIAILARLRGYPVDRAFSLEVVWQQFKRSILALAMPVIILVGFRLGAVTATEIAGIAAAYAAIVGVFIYRTVSIGSLPRIIATTARETAVILFIAAAATPLSWVLGIEQAPQIIVEFISGVTSTPWVVLLILNIALLIVGMFMDTIAVIIILVPILLPLLQAMQIDLTQFGVVLLINLVLGQLTPPVGVLLFVAMTISKVSLVQVFKETVPFFLSLLVALMLITYIPEISLWLPAFLGF